MGFEVSLGEQLTFFFHSMTRLDYGQCFATRWRYHTLNHSLNNWRVGNCVHLREQEKSLVGKHDTPVSFSSGNTGAGTLVQLEVGVLLANNSTTLSCCSLPKQGAQLHIHSAELPRIGFSSIDQQQTISSHFWLSGGREGGAYGRQPKLPNKLCAK